MRAFGVSRSASPEAPTSSSSTSFDTIRFRYEAASGPITETYALGRGAACNVVTVIDLEGSERVPEQGGAKGAGSGVRPGAAPARPVPDREVARAPRRGRSLVPARPRGLGLPGQRGGRRAAHAHLGGARRAAEGDRHAGHPLRHPLEPLRRRVHGCPLVCDPRACRPASERPLRDRARGGGLHGERPCVVPRRRGRAARDARRRRAAHARSTAGRSASSSPASTSGRAPSGSARSSCARPTRRASGSATGTTTTPTPGRKSGTRSEG